MTEKSLNYVKMCTYYLIILRNQTKNSLPGCLAGMVRFERTSHGVKVRCLNRLATPLCMKKAARQMWAAVLL